MTMLAMMEFIDNLSLEERLSWQISRGDGEANAELVWCRTAEGSQWILKTDKKPQGFTYDRHGMAAHLAATRVNQEVLTRQLGASIMTQALYADLMLEGARRLFGETALHQGLGSAKKFVENVTANLAPAKPQRPRLSLVAGNDSAGS